MVMYTRSGIPQGQLVRIPVVFLKIADELYKDIGHGHWERIPL